MSKKIKYPTQKRLKELFDYHEDGKLIRKIKASNNTNIGETVGWLNHHDGYYKVSVDGNIYFVHILIWIWHKGYTPENDIDHPDRIKLNNRIENLREVSRSCNIRNTGNSRNNKSGVKGVCWHINQNKWRAQIVINGLQKHLGYHDDFNEAVLHRIAAEQCLDWSSCDPSSPAYKYAIENNLIKRER